QAEDGIRDYKVTGVQTCALPIYAAAVLFTSEEERRLARESFRFYRCNEKVVNYGTAAPPNPVAAREKFLDTFPRLREQRFFLFRSEERRVGKECRFRW